MTDQHRDVTEFNKSSSSNSAQARPASSIRFEELAKGENEVVIEFQNQKYRLRVTKNGKLILNK